MEITGHIHLNEQDVRKIIQCWIEERGHKLIGELTIITVSKKDIPEGAMMGDCIGIEGKLELGTVLGHNSNL